MADESHNIMSLLRPREPLIELDRNAASSFLSAVVQRRKMHTIGLYDTPYISTHSDTTRLYRPNGL